jgi:hypothetical protein
MPNRELKNEWKSCCFGVTYSGVLDSKFQRDLTNVLRAESFSSVSLRTLMTSKLSNLSFFDTINENSYHMLFVGIFRAVFGTMVSSNQGNGHGHYDIAI